ncbi:nucleoside triphosphate pyrophosphohydrolase [Desulfolucanica intricata]|uniref:nucleoside triphosphate pyrophosphohydrolase n=1 Tax=Desulfolucanica intricata TaxID=1285191 RepID=UPI00082E7180|nr:nucleoside triphosphate pyrophosphohydrolase [Desulfolucanica intricata]
MKDITVIGLGPGAKEHLSLAGWEILQQADKIFLRTGVHPVVPWLAGKGIKFKTFDHLYEEAKTFQDVYRAIAESVLREAREGPLVYAVPGHPLVAETSVKIILQEALEKSISVRVVPAMSFIDVLVSALKLDPSEGMNILDGLQLEQQQPVPGVGNIITQVYSRMVAADVKLSLLEHYPDEHPVKVVRAAGISGEERIEEVPLYTLDRLDWIDHLTSVYVPPYKNKSTVCKYPMDHLVKVMAALRAENGCPWDLEQTHQSLGTYLLEETYEVLETISEGDMNKLCEELGDLLLQIVFHAQIAHEKNYFDINDVVDVITEKMIRRHPHVFASATVKDSAEVLVNWEKIKKQEHNGKRRKSKLDGIPKGLPALVKAAKVQAKAATVGFDWPDYHGAWEKIGEEIEELERAINGGDAQEIQKELGDVIFAVVNVARLLNIDSETALVGTVKKFTDRFNYIEEQVNLSGKKWSDFTLQELDLWWEKAKKTVL